MEGDAPGATDLSRGECVALLRSVPLGRLVHSHRALPTIRPVNFLLLADGIYLCTAQDSSIERAAQAGDVVAFEADQYDAEGRYGWSVVVLGRAVRVTEAGTLARLRELPLSPWASGTRDEVVRIPLELVSGRRAGDPARPAPAVAPVP